MRAAVFAGCAFVLAALSAAACMTAGSLRQDRTAGDTYAVRVPLGLDLAAPVPDDNPLTAAKVELGRQLFFDPILSSDGSRSCASCHQPGRYFADGRRVPVGIHDRRGSRNVPTLLNVAYGRSFFWDGRAATLEEQVLEPIQAPSELGSDLSELVGRLEGRPDLRAAFRDAFRYGAVSPRNLARALASYLRTLRSGDAPIDRYLAGDTTALSTAARRGFRLFVGRANCGVCHLAPLFTDHRFHNTGVSWGSDDPGRAAVTGRDEDRGAFKTPGLRNVAHTAPYMHDGSLATLEKVIEHYDGGGTSNPYLDEEIEPLGLSDAEKRELIAFLRALTGSSPEGGERLTNEPQGSQAVAGEPGSG